MENLDCAACAARIEQELKKTEGVEDAVLDFASLTLHLKAVDVPKALAAINRIEPGIILTPAAKDRHEGDVHGPDRDLSEAGGYRKEAWIIGVSAVIFVCHLIFENRFHSLPLPWVWVEYATAFAAYLLAGWNVLAGAVRTVRRGLFFDENVLMVIATIGAMSIHALSEAVGVMLFFKVGELLQNMAVARSRRSVHGLLAARPDRALVKTGTGLTEMAPEQVNVGDIILIKPGEKVPLDGEVIEGMSQVDTSPLTGEPIPVQIRPGDTVMAGAINTASALTVRVTKPFLESSISRVLELVESATARKAATEKFITTFARYYTPAVVAVAIGGCRGAAAGDERRAVFNMGLSGAGAAGHILSLRARGQHPPGIFRRHRACFPQRDSRQGVHVYRCPGTGQNRGMGQDRHIDARGF